jgi:hypothetical protein
MTQRKLVIVTLTAAFEGPTFKGGGPFSESLTKHLRTSEERRRFADRGLSGDRDANIAGSTTCTRHHQRPASPAPGITSTRHLGVEILGPRPRDVRHLFRSRSGCSPTRRGFRSEAARRCGAAAPGMLVPQWLWLAGATRCLLTVFLGCKCFSGSHSGSQRMTNGNESVCG